MNEKRIVNKPEKMPESLKELVDEVEDKIVTYSFSMNGFPKGFHKEVDKYCKDNFGDNRFAMFKHLWDYHKNDTRYKLLDDKIDALEEKTLMMLEQLHRRLEIIENRFRKQDEKLQKRKGMNLLSASDR